MAEFELQLKINLEILYETVSSANLYITKKIVLSRIV
jgi:hypothetical protein